jgi:hypothetical protein
MRRPQKVKGCQSNLMQSTRQREDELEREGEKERAARDDTRSDIESETPLCIEE